eukprot:jgi/Botrbrau1/13785/Bobra.0056s0036.1
MKGIRTMPRYISLLVLLEIGCMIVAADFVGLQSSQLQGDLRWGKGGLSDPAGLVQIGEAVEDSSHWVSPFTDMEAPGRFWSGVKLHPYAAAQTCGPDSQTLTGTSKLPLIYCLNLLGDDNADDAPILNFLCNGSPKQLWDIERDNATGLIQIKNSAFGKCWNLENATVGEDYLRQSACNSTKVKQQQSFSLRMSGYVPNCKPGVLPLFQIVAAADNGGPLCLTVPDFLRYGPLYTSWQLCNNLPTSRTQHFAFEAGFLVNTPPPPPLAPPPPPPPFGRAGSRISVLTDRYDPGRTGINSQETVLTPSLVSNSSKFGPVGSWAVKGQVYAHPLVIANLTVGARKVTGVVIATEENYVYLFDADKPTAQTPLWVRGPLGIPVSVEDVGGCDNISPSYGITKHTCH